MTIEQMLLALVGACCGVLGWFANVLYQATQDLRRDLSTLEVQLNKDYVRYDRLQDALKPIVDGIAEIKHALKDKQDKA